MVFPGYVILVSESNKSLFLFKDTDSVFERLGIEGASLTHKNSTQHIKYRDNYDDKMRDLVAERYRRSIEYFGYDS